MQKDREHAIRRKCREHIIGYTPFRYRFGKGCPIREGLLNISVLPEKDGGTLVLTFIFDSDDFSTDNDIHDRMSRLDFSPLSEKGLLTALRNSTEFEQNENFAMHEFSFYFEKLPSNLQRLVQDSFIPFFLDRLYMRFGDLEWMQTDGRNGLLNRLKNRFCLLSGR
ncbi:hypothetical protein [Maridesulfovibrio sp. FT414]|uniref:hypothetical protein n=1 Tax=Maridesulfovibrio sp. FT414 TaxID=2979469 RepID=UPI003D803331